MGIRKNAAALSAGERKRFVQAVLRLKETGRYDEFVKIHQDISVRDGDPFEGTGTMNAHTVASFLPWHRKYLLDFERALQRIDPSVTVPYWNWTVHRTAKAAIWADDFLGGNGVGSTAEVVTGAFAHRNGKWKITVQDDDRAFLVRAFGGDVLPRPADLTAVLNVTTYDVAPWNALVSTGFRSRLEGLHGTVHTWVGGQMQSTVSPNDPVFWLHHSFVDKCWSDWQKRHSSADYLPTGGTDRIVDLHEPMSPWPKVTPADMVNHTEFYTYA